MIDVEKIRNDFPMLSTQIHGKPLVYLDNSATTQKPQQVIDSIIDFYSSMNCNVHRGSYALGEQVSSMYEQVRIKVKEFLHATSEKEIIFTSGTTESINMVAHCFGETCVSKDDEIIVSEMEHHSNIVPWQMLCKRVGAHLKVIPMDDEGQLQMDVFESLLSEKTKLVAVTAVSNVLGTVNPIKNIVQLAHIYDTPVLVDGAQAVQHFPIDVQELDCDFFVFSGHKIFSETGIGVLYAKEKFLEQMSPHYYGGGMVSSVGFDQTTFADIPLRFEAGTKNISAVISLGSALDYVQSIGLDNIHTYEQQLVSYLLEQLETVDGITMYGPMNNNRCGIVSFTLKNVHHYDAAMILDKMGVAVRSGSHCAEPVMKHFGINGTIRASLTFYNTKRDIDQFIQGLQKVQEMHQ